MKAGSNDEPANSGLKNDERTAEKPKVAADEVLAATPKPKRRIILVDPKPAPLFKPVMLFIGVMVSFIAIFIGNGKITVVLMPTDLAGKTYLVTGCADDNVEFEIAKILLDWNASTVICTASTKGDLEKIKEIMSKRKFRGQLVLEEMEPREFSAVRSFAEKLKNTQNVIDGLVLYDGVQSKKRSVTGDGYDEMYQVNHLSPFLLLKSIEGNLGKEARVVSVSSMAYFYHGYPNLKFYGTKPGGRDHENPELSMFATYADTKIMQVLTTFYMSKRIKEKDPQRGVTFNSYCPGILRPLPDSLGNSLPKSSKQAMLNMLWETVTFPLRRSTREGAIQGVMLLTMPQYHNTSKMFFSSYIALPVSKSITQKGQEIWYNKTCEFLDVEY